MPTDAQTELAFVLGIHLLRERRKHGNVANPLTLFRQYKKILTTVAKEEGVRGEFKVGCYRIAFVTADAVYKLQYNEHLQSCILKEFEFIRRMREGTYWKHFPQTSLVRALSFPVMVQERINMNHRGIPETLHMQAKLLGKRLGLEDIHHGNYGWKGKWRQEYPVFVDVDFHSTSERKLRSWFV